MSERDKKIKAIQEDYEYGFETDAKIIFETGKGLNEDIIREISKAKDEPEWMLEYRLKSYKLFKEMTNPKWGPDLSEIDFDDFTYFVRNTDGVKNTWDDVPEEIKTTFERLGIPQAEREYLAGVSTQFESEVVYHSTQTELDDAGIIYLDTDSALKKYPELFKKYFGTVVPNHDNKYAALNGAVWSGGSFIYVPKDAKISKPIQSYFRMNSNQLGQFERTLIIVEEGAEINYIEGCTAPTYSIDSLHAAVVEVVVHKNANCRYTTIQNWSSNVLNLVTKRAHVYQNGLMEWIDGNMGSSINMKYPACILLEPYAKGNMISIAVAGKNQNQDAGAKMIHLAPHTSSNIISKSISHSGGTVNYRGKVFIAEDAVHSKSHIECDTIILDEHSYSDTIPINIVHNSESTIEHEATVSKISEDQLFYLMSRGLTEEQATEMILMGFIEPFARELPMEYAVELNHLIKMEMEGSIG
jgi:Fe-S cluster assembly protein SufB